MHIEMSVKTDRYRYLWLRYVRGFSPGVHCAKCLQGEYDNLLQYRQNYKGQTLTKELDTHRAPYVYLCGVTPRWEENLHIAFRPLPGSVIEYTDRNIAVVITDAQQCDIFPLPQDVIDMEELPPAFHTCRNYRFGWHTFPDDRREMKGFERI